MHYIYFSKRRLIKKNYQLKYKDKNNLNKHSQFNQPYHKHIVISGGTIESKTTYKSITNI
jgi:hypothetical protein